MSRMVRAFVLLLALALISASLGTGTSIAQGDPRPDLRVRLQFARPGGVFDPAKNVYASDYFVSPSIFNYLVRWKPGTDGSVLEGDLAERWTVSPDGRTYTFYLRKGVQFHKGFGELTSEDVVFTFQRQAADENMTYFENTRQIAKIEALGRYTVRMQLKEPNAAFLPSFIAYIPGFIVSKKAVTQLGENFSKTPIGTGPFVFEGLTVGREVVVVANDQYFRGRPRVGQITFAHIPDEIVAATALIKGEFQVIWTRGNPEAVTLLQNAPGVKIQRVVSYHSLRHISTTASFKPTQDVRVRRALSHAINRQQIVAAFPGLEVPTDVVRTNKLFGGSLNVPRYPYNPQKAKELLTEAGYPNGFKVRIMFQTRSPEDILATIVQSSWRGVGIDATLEPVEPTLAFDRRNRLDFETTVVSVGRPADPDLSFSDLFWSKNRPPASYNFSGYAGVDDLIMAGRHEQDPAKRQLIYEQLQRKVMTDLPIIPLSYQVFVAAWRAPVLTMMHGINNNFLSDSIEVVR